MKTWCSFRTVVDDGEHLEPAIALEAVRDEIKRPDLVWCCRLIMWNASHGHLFYPPSVFYLKSELVVNPLCSMLAHDKALSLKQKMKARQTEPSMLS